MSILRDLASFVTQASIGTLSEHERTTQRRHVADTFLAATAGCLTTEGRALRALLPRATPADAAGALAAIVRHTEIDDIHMASCVTPSSVAVPCAFGLAAHAGDFDPGRVGSAIWIGTELMTRLSIAINGARILYRGIWPTYITAPLGAAAIAARMGRLSEDQTAHALSLALMLTAGRSGRFQGKIPGRSVILSIAVANGIRAADAARAGVGGDPDLLDGSWLRDAHGLDGDLATLAAGLGVKAGKERGLGGRSIYTQLSLKPFCSAKQAISSVEALRGLLDGGLKPDAIARIVVRVPPPYAGMIATKPEASSRSSSYVSAAFQMGLLACRPERLFDIERADVTNEAAAMALAAKVQIVPDETMLDAFPARYPAQIEVTTDTTILCARIDDSPGDPTRPLDDAAIADKARRVLAQAGDTRDADRLVTLGLRALRDEASCKALAEALRDIGAGHDLR